MTSQEQEFLEETRRQAQDNLIFLTDRKFKSERERIIVAAFLRCLNVGFATNEIVANANEHIEKVDVRFRHYNFQVTDRNLGSLVIPCGN